MAPFRDPEPRAESQPATRRGRGLLEECQGKSPAASKGNRTQQKWFDGELWWRRKGLFGRLAGGTLDAGWTGDEAIAADSHATAMRVVLA
ncbi:hypothetical protein N7512_008211 [Penicillium capsulatum]|nr:hypothetical protein N7512_008211 [Penicillium capsulatum]